MQEITLEAKVENIERVTQFVDELLEANDCSMKAQMQIDIAIDELFSNIAYYAYKPNTGMATVRVEFTDKPKTVSVSFTDEGIQYNPLERDDPDVTLSVDERQIGGLGIYMVKKSMDGMDYRYEDGKNILTIKKIIL